MKRWVARIAILTVLGVGILAVQDTVELYALKGWIALTQPASPQANPTGRAVADVVLQRYYDRLEAVAFYRTLEACQDQNCLSNALYDLDPHANLYTSEEQSESLSCSLLPDDQLQMLEQGHTTVYLRIHTFELSQECLQQIWGVVQQAQRPNHLVLDLRGNGGGYYEDALALAGFFVPEGRQVNTPLERYPKEFLLAHFSLPLQFSQNGVVNRLGERYPFTDMQPRKVQPERIVILIDRDSASASEIFANLVRQYADSEVLIAGDEVSFGVGNTIMGSFMAGAWTLDLPTAVLPGLPVYTEPSENLRSAAKAVGVSRFPALKR